MDIHFVQYENHISVDFSYLNQTVSLCYTCWNELLANILLTRQLKSLCYQIMHVENTYCMYIKHNYNALIIDLPSCQTIHIIDLTSWSLSQSNPLGSNFDLSICQSSQLMQ